MPVTVRGFSASDVRQAPVVVRQRTSVGAAGNVTLTAALLIGMFQPWAITFQYHCASGLSATCVRTPWARLVMM